MRAKQVHEDLGVGIGSSGRGGVGNNNMITPQSQGAYAHQEETMDKEEELCDLDLGDLKGDFFNESLEFKQGGDPYEKLKIGKYNQPIINDSIIRINRDIQAIDYKNEKVFLEKGETLVYQDPTEWESYDPNNTPYFYIIKPSGKTYLIGSKTTQWLLNHPEAYDYMGSDAISESLNFEQGGNAYDKLGVGSFKPTTVEFRDWNGKLVILEIKNNTFQLEGMEIKLEFYENNDELDDENFKGINIYIDGNLESDLTCFQIKPAKYEFFAPSGENDGMSAYGFPLVDRKDTKKLKEMQDKYATWHVKHNNLEYHRTSIDPFIAVANIILFLY